jgi:hypothetical protein
LKTKKTSRMKMRMKMRMRMIRDGKEEGIGAL